MTGSTHAHLHRQVLQLMQSRDWRAADLRCRDLIAQFPRFAGARLTASQIAMASGAAIAGLEHIEAALAMEPTNPKFLLQRAQCLLALGDRHEALLSAEAAVYAAPRDSQILDAVGTLRSYANDQQGALAVYDDAVALAPDSHQFRYNRASVRRFLGDLEGAESDYDQVIAQKPSDHEAYLNRSELRIQTTRRNHVAELTALLLKGIADWRGEVQVRYALAKELEDLGRYAESFEQLRSGAARRRQHMKYDIATDLATVDWIIRAFPSGPLPTVGVSSVPPSGVPSGNPSGVPSGVPIFIVGLPRSGTTLVERILSSHSQVASAAELDCFASSIVAGVRRESGRAHLPRNELVALSAALDFASLGEDYLRRARASFGGSGRFIDKMPLNYLYCGLIRRALPRAKIVHLTRAPMAVGYAMYKTLFKDGYPFSYDLSEIGRYIMGYRKLMQHWHTTMPGVIHDLSYEALVSDQIGETRRLLKFCDLEWEEACVTFHQNAAASTTASASQVRRPMYASSLSQWRHYEQQLSALWELVS